MLYHNGVKTINNNERNMSADVMNYSFPVKERFNHPTIKPLAMIKSLISKYSNPNDIVLDPFLGSGTTTIACKQLNRHSIGIEKNPEYCKIAQKRVDAVPKRLDRFME